MLGFVKCCLYTLPVMYYLGWCYSSILNRAFFRRAYTCTNCAQISHALVRGLCLVTIVALIGYCVLHFCASLLHRGETPPFSLNNFIHGGTFRFTLAFDALIFSPLKEEFLFRLLVHNFFLSRNPNSPVVCVLYTSFVFAAYHLLNSLTGRFSFAYIFLQVRFRFFFLPLTQPDGLDVLLVLWGRVLRTRVCDAQEHLGALPTPHGQQRVRVTCATRSTPKAHVARVPAQRCASLSHHEYTDTLPAVGNFTLHVALLFMTLHNFERKWT